MMFNLNHCGHNEINARNQFHVTDDRFNFKMPDLSALARTFIQNEWPNRTHQTLKEVSTPKSYSLHQHERKSLRSLGAAAPYRRCDVPASNGSPLRRSPLGGGGARESILPRETDHMPVKGSTKRQAVSIHPRIKE